VYAEGGQDEQALSCWTDALEAFEQSHQAGRSHHSQELAQLYLYRGMMYGRLLHYQEAIADCDRALEYAPDEAEALAVRGIARAYLGELDLALADCLQAVEVAPQVDHLSRLGEVYLLRKEYRQACEVLDRATALDPTNERVALQLRRALGGMVLEIMQTETPVSQTSDDETASRPLVSQPDAEESTL
jgi:tetratricopeptide (TPR) repeat protein